MRNFDFHEPVFLKKIPDPLRRGVTFFLKQKNTTPRSPSVQHVFFRIKSGLRLKKQLGTASLLLAARH
jgi:hypothetical protein